MIRMNEGSKMHLSHVIMDGEVGNPKYAIVSPDKKEANTYNLFIDNVTFRNFKTKNGGSVFKAYNGTQADTLSFKNSRFENIYRGLNLSYDKDIFNFYNAKTIILENTVFIDVEEFAVNYVRKTPSVELPGGKLVVNNCIFDNVYNQEKGKVLQTNGIHTVEISNSIFTGSYKMITTLDLKGKSNFISNSLIYKSGFVKISKNAQKTNLIYKNPKWDDKVLFIPSKKSLLLKENNKIENIGLKL
jgi:poly(beta-D-mannuronate) lyase